MASGHVISRAVLIYLVGKRVHTVTVDRIDLPYKKTHKTLKERRDHTFECKKMFQVVSVCFQFEIMVPGCPKKVLDLGSKKCFKAHMNM